MSKSRSTSVEPEPSRKFERLTQVAFVLAMALVVARGTMQDHLRSRSEPLTSEAPRGAGPAAGIGLDLLCCVPALLVMARRVSDRQYVLRAAWGVLPLAALAGWGVLSTLWAADRFGALAAGFHWVAAAAMAWAGVQLVRSWLRLRVVAAVVFGLLLAYGAQSAFFKLVDAPATRETYFKNRAEILKSRGIDEKSFAAKRYDDKVIAAELMGFFNSANTMGAVVVLLGVVSLGLGAQRLMDDRKDAAGAAILGVAAAVAGWMIFAVQSKTAVATPLLAIGLAAVAWHWRDLLARHARPAFWIGVGVVLFGIAAVIGHGAYHGGLPGESLNFRWDYWVAAERMFARHAAVGVGLDNFGAHYLGVRLTRAAEEVKDPHNFLVRFFCELGAVGGLLCVAWVGRVAWELTRPVAPAEGLPVATAVGRAPRAERLKGEYAGSRAIWTFVVTCAVALLINVVSSVDFKSDAWYVMTELLQKLAVYALLVVGASLGAIKSFAAPELDARPAPVVLYAMIAGLAVFLVHNLVDFSLFEAGPLTAFAFLCGGALGVRQPSVAGKRRRTAAAAVSMAVAVVAWMVAAGFAWAPTVAAEDAAADAAAAMRADRPREAVNLFRAAARYQPLNADYAIRAATVEMRVDPDPRPALALLDLAIRTDPMALDAYRARAQLLSGDKARAADVRRDYERVMELNPNDANLRIEYADVLATLGDRGTARRQYEEALRFDSLLRGNEPKRLSAAKVADVRGKIAGM